MTLKQVLDVVDPSERGKRRKRMLVVPALQEGMILDFGDNERSETKLWKEIKSACENGLVGIVGVGGMCGVGKTTACIAVAEKVQKESDELESKLFEMVLWVQLRRNMSLEDVVDKMLEVGEYVSEAGVRPHMERGDVKRARAYLEKSLEGHRLLVFIDDVWNSENVEGFVRAFGSAQNGSVLVMSSRNKNVLHLSRSKSLISLDELLEEDALELMRRKTGDKFDEEMAKKVFKENGRVAMAVGIIGGLVAITGWDYTEGRCEGW
ncbi:hypothetical protein NDN08_001002 [Rhodosorus marinus]|uniref:NB-ARC domain-containing protein n=1 Tax=Rhodosorus marinus TaxID=101924 RepID=A0AAV8UPT8_9RHOD|nr:hypothetical protein NDN08_001002 [Rhodosorus marinus]